MGAKRTLILLLSFILKASLFVPVKGQTVIGRSPSLGLLGQDRGRLNTIATAVPFLRIVPDARGAGMGNTGISVSPDRNANFWNPSKLAFAQENAGVGVSYVPWLRNFVSDIDLGHASGYYKLNEEEAIGISTRYFSLGDIQFTTSRGNQIGVFRPREYMISLSYSRKLSEKLSGGLSAKYIYSDLTGGANIPGNNSSPVEAPAADLSLFYTNDEVKFGNGGGSFNFGLNISNIGPKVSYHTQRGEGDFMPMNLGLGPTFIIDFNEDHRLSISHELNKLLVPSPPIYGEDPQGRRRIIAGRDPDEVGVASGIFGSFSDAPGRPLRDENGDIVLRNDGSGRAEIEDGSRFEEELREVTISGGIEYEIFRQFKLRAGYFYEHPSKGGREFVTLGTGIRYEFLHLDISYLRTLDQRNPLHQTVRVSLGAEF